MARKLYSTRIHKPMKSLKNILVISYIRIKSMQKSFDLSRGAETVVSLEFYRDDIARQDKNGIASTSTKGVYRKCRSRL